MSISTNNRTCNKICDVEIISDSDETFSQICVRYGDLLQNDEILRRSSPFMLSMIGFGENLDSGFPKIIAAWKETNWGEPELKNKIELLHSYIE